MSERKHIRMLLVNDENEYCERFQEVVDLSSYCYDIDCHCVENAKEAIDAIAKWNPDLVMLDLFLPDMDSSKVLNLCTKEKTPIIVTSEEQLIDVGKNYLDKGVSGYFKLGEDPEEFDQILSRVAELANEKPSYQQC